MLELLLKKTSLTGRKLIPSKYKYFYSIYSYRTHIYEKYGDLKSYFTLINGIDGREHQYTSQGVGLLGTKFGMSQKDLLQTIGIPKATIKIQFKINVQILYYKKYIGGQRAKIEFHFYKEQLFFINVKFSRLKPNTKSDIVKVLHDKYGEGIEFDNAVYMDSNHNALMVQKNINMNLDYFSLNSDFVHDLTTLDIFMKKKYEMSREEQLHYFYQSL